MFSPKVRLMSIMDITYWDEAGEITGEDLAKLLSEKVDWIPVVFQGPTRTNAYWIPGIPPPFVPSQQPPVEVENIPPPATCFHKCPFGLRRAHLESLPCSEVPCRCPGCKDAARELLARKKRGYK